MITAEKHIYQDFLHKVEKPARYTGGEYQSVQKDWAAVEAKLALCFPDVYEIGMSHLGMRILYSLLNKMPRVAAERCFAPWPDMERELRARRLPLVSLETARPLREFDVVGFSLQYEMTYTNLLNMLDLGEIPIHSEARDLAMPLVIAGGPSATHPEPLAPFIDIFVVGDGEEILPTLLLYYQKLKKEGRSKTEILIELSKLKGIYAPALYATRRDSDTGFVVVDKPLYEGVPPRVERAFVGDINKYPFPTDTPIPFAEMVFDRFSIELARGCTEGCRFCQAGMIYRPVRERSPEQVLKTVLEGIQKTGYDEVSLTSLSTADYSAVTPLVKELMGKLLEEKVSLSVSSLRAYGLSEELLGEIAKVRTTSLTFAPEAGTQRMRDVIAKNISEEDILTTSERVFRQGWTKMKFYFMIGLPTETPDDVIGICETAEKALKIGRRLVKGKAPEVTVSVSSFVPKPHTPFQWCAMNSQEEIRAKQELVEKAAKEKRLGYRFHEARISHLEGIVSRGDRTVGNLIEAAWRKGCRFDGWDEWLQWEKWMEALAETGLEKEIFLRTIPVDGAMPWSHIDVGVTTEFLAKEYKKAVGSRLSPPCGKPFRAKVHHTNIADALAEYKKPLVCYQCGIACDLTQMRDERIAFLKQLGAEQRREAPMVVAKKIDANGKPIPKFKQTAGIKYQAEFTKMGQAAFLSHLDLVRLLQRIFRRASIPLNYSQGFHPIPKMSFSPALSLGLESLGEWVEFEMAEETPRNTDDLRALLNSFSPPGVYFKQVILRCQRVPQKVSEPLRGALATKDLPFSKKFQTARYLVLFSPGWNGTELSYLKNRIAEVKSQPQLSLERVKEGEKNKITVDTACLRFEIRDQIPTEVALLTNGATPNLEVQIDLSNAGTPKITELLLEILPPTTQPARILRLGFK